MFRRREERTLRTDSIDSPPPVSKRGEGGGRLTRRAFLGGSAVAGLAALYPGGVLGRGSLFAAAPKGEDPRFVAEARFYEKLPQSKIKCVLCPRECVIDHRERGYCGVRENREGVYYTLVYSRPCTFHADPIEKKPFFHFLPSSLAFSLATAGCNVNCKFCQNWDISQSRPEQLPAEYTPPAEVARLAKRHSCASIAYTYSEPVVFYEYMMDSAEAGRAAGLRNAIVTGGYIKPDPLREMCARMDAIKVDLKAFTEDFYRDIVGGELRPVLDGLVTIRKAGVWNEIVYLVVPTLNDKDDEFRGLVRWIRTELGPDVPLHFTRFHPQYLLQNLPPTPIATLERAKAIADAEGLHYVYIGNVPGHPAENTNCPRCGNAVLTRAGFFVKEVRLREGRCDRCDEPIPGVWS
ncbi:MAG: AmmeMemoRadiSam system radical SAM enzyme [Candidatus Eisenbacteria bacterium]